MGFSDKLPTAEFERLKFEVIKDFGGGLRWVEIKTLEQALAACTASRTFVDSHFDEERIHNDGWPSPHCWFMLSLSHGDETRGLVIVALPGPGWSRQGAFKSVPAQYVLGYWGRHVYPRWEDEISALSVVTDTIIPPNHAGRILSDYEMLSGPRWPKKRPQDVIDGGPFY
jgi:hypothetical protein